MEMATKTAGSINRRDEVEVLYRNKKSIYSRYVRENSEGELVAHGKIQLWKKMAFQNYDTALKLDPEDAGTYCRRAQLYLWYYQFRRAYSDIRNAIQFGGSNPKYTRLEEKN